MAGFTEAELDEMDAEEARLEAELANDPDTIEDDAEEDECAVAFAEMDELFPDEEGGPMVNGKIQW